MEKEVWGDYNRGGGDLKMNAQIFINIYYICRSETFFTDSGGHVFFSSRRDVDCLTVICGYSSHVKPFLCYIDVFLKQM